MTEPLGITLNNPGNLRLNGIKWFGLVEGDNHDFCQFSTPVLGIRALLIDLKNQLVKKCNTIRLIITKYAPSSENNTTAYIANVAAWTGIDADTELNNSNIKALALAIIKQEQGQMPYGDDVVNRALFLAGLTTTVYPDPTALNSP